MLKLRQRFLRILEYIIREYLRQRQASRKIFVLQIQKRHSLKSLRNTYSYMIISFAELFKLNIIPLKNFSTNVKLYEKFVSEK